MTKLEWVLKNEASRNGAVEKLWRAYWRDEVMDLLRSDKLVTVGPVLAALEEQKIA